MYWQPTNLWVSRPVRHSGPLLQDRMRRAKFRRPLSKAESATRWSCNRRDQDAMDSQKASAAMEYDLNNRPNISFLAGEARYSIGQQVSCKRSSSNTRTRQAKHYRVSNNHYGACAVGCPLFCDLKRMHFGLSP